MSEGLATGKGSSLVFVLTKGILPDFTPVTYQVDKWCQGGIHDVMICDELIICDVVM